MRPLLPLLLVLLAAGCASSGALGGAPDAAVGPTWQLVALGAAPPSAEATLTFGDDGRVFGTAGCNRFFGSYDLAPDGALTLSQVGSTQMACAPPEMGQEDRFLSALGRADRVVIDGDRLTLVAGSDRLLTFHAALGDAASATLTGTVTHLPRIALPPDAVVVVRLLDVSRADAPSTPLAESRVEAPGQVPIPFSLGYDPSQIQPRRRYVVRAEILDARGALLWTTDTAYPVLTNGAPSSGIEVRVVQAASAAE